VGTRFGGIPSGFPHFHVPVFEYTTIRMLIAPAITVALLGAIESLMSAVVADRMSGDQHNPGQAAFAQHLGEENICAHITAALVRANAIHEQAANGVVSI
jgi:sulfate permease, SulP family